MQRLWVSHRACICLALYRGVRLHEELHRLQRQQQRELPALDVSHLAGAGELGRRSLSQEDVLHRWNQHGASTDLSTCNINCNTDRLPNCNSMLSILCVVNAWAPKGRMPP